MGKHGVQEIESIEIKGKTYPLEDCKITTVKTLKGVKLVVTKNARVIEAPIVKVADEGAVIEETIDPNVLTENTINDALNGHA